MPSFCILLVMGDDLVANRLATMVSTNCSIVRFREESDAEKWLTDGQKVDLIIVDKNSAFTAVLMVRQKADYRLVPLLVTCRFGETQALQASLEAGVTDVLVINESNQNLQMKVGYYLNLNTQVQAFGETDSSVTAHQFTLPWWKRLTDVLVSATALLLTLPVLLITALLVRLDSKGPVLYKSKRAGANFHVFDMYKFRTMSVEADQLLNQLADQNIYAQEATGAAPAKPAKNLCIACRQQGVSCQRLLIDQNQPICEKVYLEESGKSAKFMKFRNDPRVTRLGTFLRNSSLDELPQLYNILLGDMSVVGNRPLPLYEAEKLTSDEFVKRFAGPAGLTGLWQVKKRAKGQGPMSDKERTLLDIEYSTTFSFRTDVQIIWRTIFSLWQKENV